MATKSWVSGPSNFNLFGDPPVTKKNTQVQDTYPIQTLVERFLHQLLGSLSQYL